MVDQGLFSRPAIFRHRLSGFGSPLFYFLLLYLAVTILFPRPVRALCRCPGATALASFLVGFLLFVLWVHCWFCC